MLRLLFIIFRCAGFPGVCLVTLWLPDGNRFRFIHTTAHFPDIRRNFFGFAQGFLSNRNFSNNPTPAERWCTLCEKTGLDGQAGWTALANAYGEPSRAYHSKFYGELCPISAKWVPEALAVSGFTREQVMTFPEPEGVMRSFADWLGTMASGHPMFISDNNGCVLQQIMA